MPKRTPRVIEATWQRDPAGVRAALAADPAVDATDRDGRSAIHHAAIDGLVDIAALLLSLGARVDLQDRRGWAPLHFAAAGFHVDLARLLIAAGAPVDPADEHGNTPLAQATFDSNGRGEMIVMLLDAGADPERANRHGVTPRGLADTIANHDVKRWFTSAGDQRP